MTPLPTPRRGEVWWFDPEPGTVGRELGRKVRPGLIVSADEMNQGSAEKVIVVPATSVPHDIPSHIRFDYRRRDTPGLRTTYFCCEDVRSISTQRLKARFAPQPIPSRVMAVVEVWLKRVLGMEAPPATMA